MNACEEQLIASDLRELLGKKRAPDLVERTLQRLREPKASRIKEEATVHTLPAWRWQRFALAASVLIAVGLIGWLAWPRALPEGVSATASASYAVRADFIELREGALLLQTGAPEVRAAGQRIAKVNGRSVVNAGGIPTDFAALNELPLTEKEKPMLKEIKRWSVAAGVALCVLSGSALLNDKIVEAKDEAPAPEKVESPKPEDIKGLQAMLEKTTSMTVRGRDASYRMCCPVEITEPLAVKELVDAIYSGLTWAKAPAGWDSNNEITFHLSDGREIEIMVNIKDGLADLRLAGWKRYYEYTVRADLLQRFLRPLDRSVANGPDCPAPVGMRKLRGWSGSDSKIEKPDYVWVNNDKSWKATWERHKPGTSAPDIDFERERVVAIFQGRSSNSRGVELVEIIRDELSKNDEFVIRFDEVTYQTMGTGESVTPYGIFVLTLSHSHNHLQENVQGLLNNPALWLERPLTWPNATMDYIAFRSTTPTITRLRGWEGEGSGVRLDRYALITNKADWEKLWKEHKPNEAAPEVDFEKEQVVAIFQSVPEGWGGVKVTELLSSNARTLLHIRGTSYQTEGTPPELTMSYGFHVFPKGLKLVLETPNYPSMDAPPRWLETAWK
jgi:hypothetical protein